LVCESGTAATWYDHQFSPGKLHEHRRNYRIEELGKAEGFSAENLVWKREELVLVGFCNALTADGPCTSWELHIKSRFLVPG
jgi:hypothetical protein